jgi:hypothetical protein
MPDAPGYVYLLIPPDLEAELLEPLKAHFAGDESVDVVVERRTTARRSGIDDRILRDLSRPQTDRRAQTVPRGIPPLPPELEHYADRLRVVQRLPPVRAGMEDLDLEDVIRRAQEGDPGAPTEIYWRTYERVYRRLVAHLRDAREADTAVKATYGFIFDRLGDFDPEELPVNAWLDRVVDQHAERLRAAQ